MTNTLPTTTFEPAVWIDIDSAALAANVRAVRSVISGADGHSPKIMAVVKADGYGHGTVNAAQAFVAGGADALAVTTFDEAEALVSAGLAGNAGGAPLLVFNPCFEPGQARYGVSRGLTLTVCDWQHVRAAASAASQAGKQAIVQLKVDTGMGRFGLQPEPAFDIARQITATPNLTLAGVYTHFAQALAPGLSPTRRALAEFTAFCEKLTATGIDPGIRHCANSAAALRMPESRLDMVRLGTILYGQYAAHTVPRVDGLSGATWVLRARVAFVHHIEPGATVGYGSQYRASAQRRVAVIPIGFADGFATVPASLYDGFRGLKAVIAAMLGMSRPFVTFNGTRAPVLGRVSMQTIVVDVTNIADVEPGSIAEIPIRRLAARSSVPRRPSRPPAAP